MLLNGENKAMLWIVLSGILYGFLGFFGTKLLELGIPLTSMLFYRFFIAFLFCLILHFFYQIFLSHQFNPVSEKEKKSISIQSYLIPVLFGMLFYGTSPLFYFMSAQIVGTGIAMVIFFMFPIFVIALSILFLKFKFTIQYFVSLVLIFCGLILLGQNSQHHFQIKGIIFAITSASTYAFYIFFSKKMISTIPPLLNTAFVCFGCAFFYFILCVIQKNFFWIHTSSEVLYTLGISFLSTAIPAFLMLVGLKNIDACKASLVSVLEPVMTVFVGILLLHESFTFRIFLGTLVVLCGSMYVTLDQAWIFSFFKKKIIREKN